MKQFGYLVALAIFVGGVGAYALTGNPRTPVSAWHQVGKEKAFPVGEGFDFYVLSLSWSPTYCQSGTARSRDAVQCAGPRPFAFVVHGLWPQFERGYPKACATRFARPTRELTTDMLDIMPSERLVQHEWEQHGTCSGLSAQDYFEVTRAAYGAVTIPPEFKSAPDWRTLSAGEVEAAFLNANPGLLGDGIAVSARANLLSEVRICLSQQLKPRPCSEVDRAGARAHIRLSLPPSRG
jgi:ribonuclease T2